MLCWIREHPTMYYVSTGYPYGCNNYYGVERSRPRVPSRVQEAKINITKFIHSTLPSLPVSVCTQTDSRLAVSPGCGYEWGPAHKITLPVTLGIKRTTRLSPPRECLRAN